MEEPETTEKTTENQITDEISKHKLNYLTYNKFIDIINMWLIEK